MRRLAHSVAAELSDTSLAVLFPLLTVGAGALLLYLAYLGIVRRRTLYLPVRKRHRPLRQGYWVTGRTAVLTGVSHLVLALLLLAILGPISAAMVGLW